MHEIFTFQKKGISPEGKVVGVFQASRIRPRFMEQLQVAGVSLSSDIFEHAMKCESACRLAGIHLVSFGCGSRLPPCHDMPAAHEMR